MSVPTLTEMRQIYENKLSLDQVADTIRKKYHFRTIEDTDQVYCYEKENGLYKKGGDIIIKKMCQSIIPGCKTYHCHEVINIIKRLTYTARSEFDNFDNLMNVKNGILDWDTGKLLEHSPEYLFTRQIPVVYDLSIFPMRFMQFLEQCLPEFKSRMKAIEFFASTLLPNIMIDKMLMNVGEGSNGKSTFSKIIERFLGNENVSNVSIHDLMYNQFAKSGLVGKLTNIFADTSRRELGELGPIKALISGDSMYVERKGKDAFKMQNTAKLIFSCNNLPELGEDSHAVYRRLILIEWNQRFEDQVDDEIVDGVNATLLNELTTEQEKSGILNLLFTVGQIIRKNGKLSIVENHSVLREKWTEKSDPIGKFLETCVEKDYETKTPKSKLFEKFREWCKNKNITSETVKVFNRQVSQYFEIQDTIARIKENEGKPTKVWPGIKILDDVTVVTDVTPLSL